MKKAGSNITTRIIVVTLSIVFFTSVLLSAILLYNTRITSKTLINERMLDIAKCAAASVNGDEFGAITADEEAPEYKDVHKALSVFLENINDKEYLKYIYGVYQGEDGEFYFAVDTDPDNPGKYGEIAKHGDGIYEAIKGVPTVDTKSYTDEWGTFYSAYSPVLDSNKKIVGLVMVDFDASWYSNQVAADMGVIIFVCVLTLLINAVAILLTTSKLRNNLSRLYTEMDILADDISDLTDDDTESTEKQSLLTSSNDKISETIFRIRSLQKKIRVYISQMKTQAFNDSMTGVGNRTAFAERTEDLNRKIENGAADFAIAIFDINGLKHINDEHGHEAGDSIITDASYALKEVFGIENIYRIGGDEFIAILDNTTMDEVESLFDRLDRNLDDLNETPGRSKVKLFISKGAETYRTGLDHHFNDVFKRADEAMYHDKATFYLRHGDRRKVDLKTYLDQPNEHKE